MRKLALVVALVLATAGCGGSDDSSDTATTAAEAAATTTTAAATTTTTAAATTTTSGGDPSPLTKCPELAAWAQQSVLASQAALLGGGDVQASATYFQEFAESAPDEIRSDMLIYADAYERFAADLDALGIDFSDPSAAAAMNEETVQQLEEAVANLDNDEVDAALDRIQAFFDRECS